MEPLILTIVIKKTYILKCTYQETKVLMKVNEIVKTLGTK